MRYLEKFTLSLLLAVGAIPCSAHSVSRELFTIGRFEIGKTTVDEVQSSLGENEPRPIEPADGADVAFCYSTSASTSAPTIVFETGALGAWKDITAFRLTTRGKRRCRLADASAMPMATANGLSLGTERRLVQQLLSRSNLVISGPHMRVEEVYRRGPTESEAERIRGAGLDPSQIEFDVVDIVEVKFKRGFIQDLYVKRLVSYLHCTWE